MSDIATKSRTIDKHFNFLSVTGKENCFNVSGNTTVNGNLNINTLNHIGHSNLVRKNLSTEFKKKQLIRISIDGRSSIVSIDSLNNLDELCSQDNVTIEFLS